MRWQEQQEREIADTLTLVQRLAAFTPIPEPQPAAIAATPPKPPKPRKPPADPQQAMQARFEVFRNRQRFLEIEREVHFFRALQRVRDATEQWS